MSTIWDESLQPLSPPPSYPDSAINDVPKDVPSWNMADMPPKIEEAQVVRPNEFKGLPVRAGGDNIFLLKGGRRYWITSAEVYAKLGFKFGDEVKIDQATLNVIPEGEPIR